MILSEVKNDTIVKKRKNNLLEKLGRVDMNDLVHSDWYENMVVDCRAIITESVYNSRTYEILGKLQVGDRIFNDENYKKFGKGNQEFLNKLFRDIGISNSVGYRCIQCYEKYFKGKDVSLVGETMLGEIFEEGKNISWTKICTKYLPQSDGKTIEEECLHNKFMCVSCHKIFDREELK